MELIVIIVSAQTYDTPIRRSAAIPVRDTGYSMIRYSQLSVKFHFTNKKKNARYTIDTSQYTRRYGKTYLKSLLNASLPPSIAALHPPPPSSAVAAAATSLPPVRSIVEDTAVLQGDGGDSSGCRGTLTSLL